MKRAIVYAAIWAGALWGAYAHAASIDNLVNACSDGEIGAPCRMERDLFKENWALANKGDYGGQRNVAYCLFDGCSGAVRVDVVAACAWRTVILASDAAWDAGDVRNYRTACVGVRDKGADMAKILFKRIYKRPMPDVD